MTVTVLDVKGGAVAALAAEGKKVRAALIGREDETVLDPLKRLDDALDHFAQTGAAINEVLPVCSVVNKIGEQFDVGRWVLVAWSDAYNRTYDADLIQRPKA